MTEENNNAIATRQSEEGITTDMWIIATVCLAIGFLLMLPSIGVFPGASETTTQVEATPELSVPLNNVRAIDNQRFVISYTRDDGAQVFDTVWATDVEFVVSQGPSKVERFSPGQGPDIPLYQVTFTDEENKNLKSFGDTKAKGPGK